MPNQALRFDYVLVIQFLDPTDRQTGEELMHRLRQSSNFPIELVVCETHEYVLSAISNARRNIARKGIPIVHFEAHGRASLANLPAGLGYERSAACGQAEKEVELVLWKQLWPLLSKLNLASDFNLIVVAAACFGDEATLGLVRALDQPKFQVAPFMATVGFSNKIHVNRLFDAMVALYEDLHRDTPLELAVLNANKKLQENELLLCMWTMRVLKGIVAKLQEVDIDYYRERASKDGIKLDKPEHEIISDMSSWQQYALDKALSGLLSYATHPHNRERFN